MTGECIKKFHEFLRNRNIEGIFINLYRYSNHNKDFGTYLLNVRSESALCGAFSFKDMQYKSIVTKDEWDKYNKEWKEYVSNGFKKKTLFTDIECEDDFEDFEDFDIKSKRQPFDMRKDEVKVYHAKSNYRLVINPILSKELIDNGVVGVKIRKSKLTGKVYIVFLPDGNDGCIYPPVSTFSGNHKNLRYNSKDLVDIMIQLTSADVVDNKATLHISENQSQTDDKYVVELYK